MGTIQGLISDRNIPKQLLAALEVNKKGIVKLTGEAPKQLDVTTVSLSRFHLSSRF